MSSTLRRVGFASAGLATLGVVGWALAAQALTESRSTSEMAATQVEIAPPDDRVGTQPDPDSSDESPEKCTSGCSLGKHPLPPYGRGDFARARYEYAQAAPDEPSEALETLLFFGTATKGFLAEMGPGRLSPAHVAFLERELDRDAVVELRMVDDSGRVRVAYGPQQVPFGIKQHLHPVEHNLQPLEFNGTVMRTGVNYLWSRY